MRNIPPRSPVYSLEEVQQRGATRQAWAELFAAFRPELLRFAYWLARDRAVAEDVVQEAMLRAWRARAELGSSTSLRPWLLTIVRREHARLHERRRVEVENLGDLIEREDGALAQPAGDMDEELRTAILELPAGYREPLVMQVLGGYTTAEIARELGLSQSAVLTRLFRARNRLRVTYGLPPGPDCAESGEDT